MKTKIILDLISSISVPKSNSEMFRKYADKIFIGKKAYFWTDGIMALKIYYSQWIKKPEVNLSTDDSKYYIEYYIEKKDFKEAKDTGNIKQESIKEFKANIAGRIDEWFRENKKKIIIENTDFQLKPVDQTIGIKAGERKIILDLDRFVKIFKITPITMFYNEKENSPISFNSFDMYQKDMRRLHCQILLMPIRSW